MANRVCLHLLIIWILVYCRKTTGDHVSASSAQLRMLDEGEIDLINGIKTYIGKERQKLDELDRLATKVEEDRKEVETKSPLVSSCDHPVYVFRLIHRFTTTWKIHILPLIDDNSIVLEGVRAMVDSMREILPTNDDYTVAKAALLRLQMVYRLKVADVINGTILKQTTRPMTQQMAVDVTVFALDKKLVHEAFLWFNHALKHPVPPLISSQDMFHTMSRLYAQKGELLEAVDFAKKALEIDPSNVHYLSNILPNECSPTTESVWLGRLDAEERLCRQHRVQDSFPSDGSLSCFYERGRGTPMLRTKVEMLHQSPDIVMVHDFVTDDEAAELRLIAIPEFKVAKTGYPLKSQVSEIRVGKIAWLFDNSLTGKSLINHISKRISEITGLETKHPFGEALQLANYGLGGHYSRHYDYDQSRYECIDVPEKTKEAGDRIATFMIYLNHVEAGGATVFPYLNFGTRPVKNAAVFWYNYKRSGAPDFLTLHAACPVLIGEKWVANKWIREFGQVFRRPCGLSFDT